MPYRSFGTIPRSFPLPGTGGQSGVNNRMHACGIRNDVRVWQSLRLWLPLLIALLIAAVLATFVSPAYREVRASLLRTGSEPAQSGADQIAVAAIQDAPTGTSGTAPT